VESELVGRDAPLAALRGALTDAFAGRGRVAVVSGEAGIGKSALAATLAHEAEARGAIVTWGRAWEFADAPPYFPVWPCLRAIGIEPDTAELGQPFQLWERVVAALARVAPGAPVVWILEDLHAADLGTLDLADGGPGDARSLGEIRQRPAAAVALKPQAECQPVA